MRLILFFALAGSLAAQSPGTVQATPAMPATAAVPGKVIATAGPVVCTITGNAVPATTVTTSCTVGTKTLAPYVYDLQPNASITIDHHLGHLAPDGVTVLFDAVTIIIKTDSKGIATVDTAANGTRPIPVVF